MSSYFIFVENYTQANYRENCLIGRNVSVYYGSNHIHLIISVSSLMCFLFLLPFKQEAEMDVRKEDDSPCIFGPILKQKWSYACATQLIERLIFCE
jgi:hypothetical protein